MPEFIELTDQELAIVVGGVSLTGGPSLGFTGGIGTATTSYANGTTSQTNTVNGGSVGAAFEASYVLAANPPGS